MEQLKQLFKLLNRNNFFIDKCNINPRSGINNYLNGKGTSRFSKKKELDAEDKAKIKAGLILLIEDIQQVIEIL